ncbi:MAG: hypothetical protein AAFX44_15880 [Pseudomonadota bacterium]
MDREQVIQENWVDRYLLGQLSETETDRFEQYYLECPETQDDIENTQRLIDGFAGSALAALARKHQLRVDEPAPAATPRTFNWPAMAAAAIAVLCLGFALTVQRSMPENPPLAGIADVNVPIFTLGITRSVTSAQLIELPTVPRRLMFSLDIGGAIDEQFNVTLHDADGAVVWQAAEPLVADRYGSVTFSLPPGLLAAGNFEFVAKPLTGGDVSLRIPVLVETSGS